MSLVEAGFYIDINCEFRMPPAPPEFQATIANARRNYRKQFFSFSLDDLLKHLETEAARVDEELLKAVAIKKVREAAEQLAAALKDLRNGKPGRATLHLSDNFCGVLDGITRLSDSQNHTFCLPFISPEALAQTLKWAF